MWRWPLNTGVIDLRWGGEWGGGRGAWPAVWGVRRTSWQIRMCRATVVITFTWPTTDQRREVCSASSVSGCVSLEPRTLCPLLVNISCTWSQQRNNNSHLSDPPVLTCERSSPVISLPVPGDLQYRLQYTTVNNRLTSLSQHHGPVHYDHSQYRNRNIKMWTPLGKASLKISCITQRMWITWPFQLITSYAKIFQYFLIMASL